FPYTHVGGNPHNYNDLYLNPGDPRPDDLGGDGNTFKFASTPDPSNVGINSRPTELFGVRGAHLGDANGSAGQAIQTTLGRPHVTTPGPAPGINGNTGGGGA